MVNVFLSGSVSNTQALSGSVGTASASVLAANPKRMSVTLVNDSDSIVYIALGPTAVLEQGKRLNASGSCESSFRIDSTNLYTGQITGITRSGTANLTVVEMLTQ